MYYPLIKTTDAELKGFFFVSELVKKNVCPIFELTRSRRSKKNPDGDVGKRIEALTELMDDKEFVLDVTTDKTLGNAQLTSFLDPNNGYSNWVKLIDNLELEGVIPCIHFVDKLDDVKKQVTALQRVCRKLAFRADIREIAAPEVIKNILSYVGDFALILILDAGFIPLNGADEIFKKTKESLVTIAKDCQGRPNVTLVSVASSYPKTVMEPGYGHKETGIFQLEEVVLHEKYSKAIRAEINYGDYSCIHPFRHEGFARWSPRIDYPLERECIYYRYAIDDGGYVAAARALLKNGKCDPIRSVPSWGDDEIRCAAKGTPNGRNPAHWIAVRLNLHVNRQYLRLR